MPELGDAESAKIFAATLPGVRKVTFEPLHGKEEVIDGGRGATIEFV